MKFVDLLKDVDENWTIDEKARFLYVNICKNVTYDERFIYSKNPNLLYEIYNNEIDIEEDKKEGTRIICNSGCKLYKQLLDQLNIRNKLIYSHSTSQNIIPVDDVALVYWNERHQKRFTNIAGDIENCRFDLMTSYYCVGYHTYKEAKDAEIMHSKELKEIDKKIGYIKDDYSNTVFSLLSREMKDNGKFMEFLRSQGIKTEMITSDELLKAKIMFITRFIKYRDITAGANEMIKFYKKLFSNTLNKRDDKKFEAFEFIKESNDDVEVKSILQIALSAEPIYYIFSKETQTYEQKNNDEILQEIKDFQEKKGKKLMIETESIKLGKEID